MKEGNVIQVAHVVRDIDKAMQSYCDALGIKSWDVYTFAPPAVRDSMVRGKPSDHTYLLAVTWIDEVQMELMQPLTGRSIYDEFLKLRGEGLHHIKLYYPDCQKGIRLFKERGFEIIQSGKIDEDEFYYFNTDERLGYIIEIGNSGKIRAPERRFPA